MAAAVARASGFTAKAAAVCAEAAREAKKAAGSTKGIDEFVAKFAAFEANKAAGMKQLTPPDNLKSRYAKYTRAIAARQAFFERFRASGATRATRAQEAQGARLQAQEDKLAGALGLTACQGDAHR